MDVSAGGYDDAVFISYTHIDNQPFGPDHLRWISHLHEQLTSRVEQLYGDRASVWRDEKLRGNDIFAESLVERLAKVAVLVSVCSPRYINSEWCRRELDEFLRAAESGVGVQVGTKSRVFKVLKTPVHLNALPEPLTELLGYEFYEESPVDHRIREYLLNPDPEERWKFYARVDDLAQDIAGLLEELVDDERRAPVHPPHGRTVYLAESTSDVALYRDNVRRELERRGHRVLPRRTVPLTVEELTAAITEDLSRSEIAIHLLGARYGARPENDDRSIPHVELDVVGAAAARGEVMQLIWIPETLETIDDAQAALVAALQMADIGLGVEVVRAPLEAFKAYALDQLHATPAASSRLPPAAPSSAPPAVAVAVDATRVYLVHDRRDREAVAALHDELERHGHVVMLPLGDGTDVEVREVHENSMVLSDAVIIYYGAGTEHWVRMKLFDLVKARGWGRSLPFRATAVWIADPPAPQKTAYDTNEAMVLHASGGIAALGPFLDRLGSSPPGR